MKTLCSSFLFFLTFSLMLQGQTITMQSYLYASENKPYTELHFFIHSESLNWYGDTTSLQDSTSLLVALEFQGEDTIRHRFRWVFHQEKELPQAQTFHDIRRYPLDPEEYVLEATIIDEFSADRSELQIIQPLDLRESATAKISDLMLLRNVTAENTSVLAKNGLVLQPYEKAWCSDEIQTLMVYLESYGRQDSSTRYLEYGIQDSSAVLVRSYKKLVGKEVEPILLRLPLDQVSTGEYTFFVWLKDSEKNTLQAEEIDFALLSSEPRERYDIKLEDTFVADLETEEVWDAIASLYPIVPNESHPILNRLRKDEKEFEARHFLYSFWKNINLEEPGKAFNGYEELLDKLDEKFGYLNVPAYSTDRGYIYLKYGAPTEIFENEQEIDAPPYEIWVYNFFPKTAQHGVKFLFYSPGLDGQQYLLLHSNALNERRNPQWQRVLYEAVPDELEGPNYHDATDVADGYLRLAKDLFETF